MNVFPGSWLAGQGSHLPKHPEQEQAASGPGPRGWWGLTFQTPSPPPHPRLPLGLTLSDEETFLCCSSSPWPWVTGQSLAELAPGHSLFLSLKCQQDDGTSAATSRASEAAGRKGVSCCLVVTLPREGRIPGNWLPYGNHCPVACLYLRVQNTLLGPLFYMSIPLAS